MTENQVTAEKIVTEYTITKKTEDLLKIGMNTVNHNVDVGDVDVFTVGTQEAFTAIGEANEKLSHRILTGREARDEHPIWAIAGLESKLNRISDLKTVKSDKKGFADYYTWEDENTLGENRVGYFVSICNDVNTIKICSGEDIFGVVVDAVAVAGGQDKDHYDYWEIDDKFDHKRNLVAYTGIVNVRRESDVNVGDYVMSNGYGMATKSNNYGFKVVALSNIDGVDYAVISLNSFVNQIEELGHSVDNMSVRMDNAEANIIAAITTANKVHNIITKVEELDKTNSDIIQKVEDAIDKSNDVMDSVDDFNDRLTNVNETIAQATAIANNALAHADSIKIDAVKTANKAVTEVNDLIKDLNPILTWQDEDSGNYGAEYLTNYIKDGLATKSEVKTVDSRTQSILQETQTNAANIQSLITSIDKYSVGECSQAYGLTQSQAKSILSNGMIYIPTVNHRETYVTSGTNVLTQNFTSGYYYTWTDNKWIESSSPFVAMSASVPTGSSTLKYWYVNSKTAPSGYEANALYIWENSQWNKVNILDGNINNRITSMIRQSTNEITAEIVNARGSVASLGVRLDDNESDIQDLVTWTTDPLTNEAYNLASIKQTATKAGASIALVVSEQNGKDVVNTASIVAAINDNKDSAVTISANKINFSGFTTFLKASDLGASGTTSIDGARITTGKISADRIDVSNVITVGGIAKTSDIPKNTSALTNDSGFAYNNQIPTKVGQLTNDSGYQTASQVTTITNNTISTTNVVAQNLKVKAANIDGALTIGQLPTSVAETSDIPTKVSQLSNDSGYKNESGVTSIVKGVIDTDYVNALGITVDAAQIKGKLTADQIDTTKLVVGASNIAADSIGTTQLQAKSVSSVIIADGAVTASKVSADIVTAGKLETKGGVVIEGSNITAGSINVDALGTNSQGLITFTKGIDLGGDYYIFGSDYTGASGVANLASMSCNSVTARSSLSAPGMSCSEKSGTNNGILSGKWLYNEKEIATTDIFAYYALQSDLDTLDQKVTNSFSTTNSRVTALENYTNAYDLYDMWIDISDLKSRVSALEKS